MMTQEALVQLQVQCNQDFKLKIINAGDFLAVQTSSLRTTVNSLM